MGIRDGMFFHLHLYMYIYIYGYMDIGYVFGTKDDRCVALNAISLVCGLAGNVFLLFNFTRVVRYIVALPVSIVCWVLATATVTLFFFSFSTKIPIKGKEANRQKS